MRARIEFKPQDAWVGVYWKRSRIHPFPETHFNVWICLVPMVPIHLWWSRADW